MSNVEHKSTAKALVRDLFTAYGRAGVLSLLAEVAMESVPRRRGRPTRDERVCRMVANLLTDAVPHIAKMEQAALDSTPEEEV